MADADPTLVSVYALGRLGLNLVDDPLVLEDGALTLGQNAQTSPNEADGGLLKRGGLLKLNAAVGPGPVLAVLPMPFTDSV
jgi:hypothetical protein